MINFIQNVVEEIHDYCIIDVNEYINDKNEVVIDFSQENIDHIQSHIKKIEDMLYGILSKIHQNYVKNENITRIIDDIHQNIYKYDFIYFTTVAHEEWKNRKELLIHYNRFQLKNKKYDREMIDYKENNEKTWCYCFKFMMFKI